MSSSISSYLPITSPLPKAEHPQENMEMLNLCSNTSVQEILKCFFCEKFLSVPPVFNHEFETICGRCKFVNKDEDSKWTRQVVYESIAQYMIFPCSNVSYGCKAQLKWGDVPEHENTCVYKKLNCPFYHDDIFETEKCRWQGSGPGLNEHLENCHGHLIKKLPEINFTATKSNSIFLARMLKQLMLVVVKYEEPEQFSCLVMVNGTSTDCDAYRFQLEMYDESKKNFLVLRRSRLEDAVGLEENMINPDKMLVFNLGLIKELLKKPSTVMGRFGIIKKSRKEINLGDRCLHQEPTLDESLLRELECPICKNYMLPPIVICRTGHSFCSSCRDQMDDCPTCRYPFQEGRNYTLEKLTSAITYPCMYKEVGCYFTCSSDKLKEHEQECTFSGSKCFFNTCCEGTTVMNMFKHLNEKHQDCLIVAGDLHILDVGVDEEETFRNYAICFGNDIFRLVVKYDGVQFIAALQQFGVTKSNYTYELEMICSAESTDKLIIAKECPPLNSSLWHKSVTVVEDMIEKFISEEDLIFFKVHLKKIS